ncbi:hypothetical protein M5D96_000505, partial [Drosophila gunungcola]
LERTKAFFGRSRQTAFSQLSPEKTHPPRPHSSTSILGFACQRFKVFVREVLDQDNQAT